jgi:hypothetical protein
MKAYPYMHKHPTSGQTTISEGMDLRDYFAAMFMQGEIQQKIHVDEFKLYAIRAYRMADLMMKQRKEVPNE